MVNRIREWRTKRDWSLQQLAEASGTTRAQIDKLERGERRLTVDWMMRLAAPLGCLPADLLPASSAPAPAPEPERMIPVRGALHPAGGSEMALKPQPIDHRPCPCFMAHVRDAYALYLSGEAMSPMYRPGQLLYINPHKPPIAGNGIVMTRTDGTVLVRELVRATAFGLVVREYQPRLREFTIPQDTIADVHVIVAAEEPGN